MPWPAVDTDEIKDRWRPLTTAEQRVAEKRILDAESELRSGLRLRGVDGTPSFDTAEELTEWKNRYIRTVADAVQRYLGNPDGWLEEREQIDDYTLARRRDSSRSTGNIYLEDAEIDRLVPKMRRRRGAFSITLGQT